MTVSDLILQLIKMEPEMQVKFITTEYGNDIDLGNVTDVVLSEGNCTIILEEGEDGALCPI